MALNFCAKLFLLWIIVIGTSLYVVIANMFLEKVFYNSCSGKYNFPLDFEGFNNETGDSCKIVPNYVHFLRFGIPSFSFVEAVCVLAALQNQNPDIIFFHTDNPDFEGKYWNLLLKNKRFREIFKIVLMENPTEIFGQKIQTKWIRYHGGDIARLIILMEYGGIFLDNDSFIVKNLDQFRKFEMTLGWTEEENNTMSNQVIIAHKNARFLRYWIYSYVDSYDKNSWFYNAGEKPTKEILSIKPHLIHRVKKYFAEYYGMLEFLYLERRKEWKDHYAFHLLIGHTYLITDRFFRKNTSREVNLYFDEFNIKEYPITFQDMVASVYPF